jgi:hypothetical protein
MRLSEIPRLLNEASNPANKAKKKIKKKKKKTGARKARAKKKAPVDDCEKLGGRWVTMPNDVRVCINKKGDVIKGPSGVAGDSDTAGARKAQEEADRILKGKSEETGVETTEDDEGVKVRNKHTGDEVKVAEPGKKPSLTDVLAGLVSQFDIMSAAAIRFTGKAARGLQQSVDTLGDLLNDWMAKG